MSDERDVTDTPCWRTREAMFSKFFIDRPIFATVIALLMVLGGLLTVKTLPVAQYPDITPPTVFVMAS